MQHNALGCHALEQHGPQAAEEEDRQPARQHGRQDPLHPERSREEVGAEVEEGNDYIKITPPAQLVHAAIDTYNDHRMAMCFSLVALSDTPVTINDPGCTSKTFPDYFERFTGLVQA